MDTIYCLVGPSGSGKTTIAQALENEYEVIQSYTTRPPRSENEWGHTFVEKMPEKPTSKVIACNNFNGFDYWATEEQYLGKGKTIYIIDPPGIEMLKKEITNAEIVVIFLRCDKGTCYKRLVARLDVETDDRLEAAIKKHGTATERIRHDEHVFAICQADWVIDSTVALDEVLERVRKVLEC